MVGQSNLEGGNTFRFCKKCSSWKSLEGFGKDIKRHDWIQFYCRSCVALKSKEYRIKYPEKYAQGRVKSDKKCRERISKYMANYRLSHRERLQELSFIRKFGIDRSQYNQMVISQDGKCAICMRSQYEFKKALHIDHDHKTGNIRGLLCSMCNTAIGLFRDCSTTARRASTYLA